MGFGKHKICAVSIRNLLRPSQDAQLAKIATNSPIEPSSDTTTWILIVRGNVAAGHVIRSRRQHLATTCWLSTTGRHLRVQVRGGSWSSVAVDVFGQRLVAVQGSPGVRDDLGEGRLLGSPTQFELDTGAVGPQCRRLLGGGVPSWDGSSGNFLDGDNDVLYGCWDGRCRRCRRANCPAGTPSDLGTVWGVHRSPSSRCTPVGSTDARERVSPVALRPCSTSSAATA